MDPARGELHEHPVRWLRRLPRQAFARLMGASIEAVLLQSGRCTSGEARRLRQEVLGRFASELVARTRRVRALTRSECLAELERTHGALLRERLRHARELVELEGELGRVRRAARPAPGGPGLTEALAADLRALLGSGREVELARLLGRESERRERAFEAEARRSAERIERLERRIAKLRAALAATERALAELARRAELDPGLPSIYRTAQGLPADEEGRELKLGMLAQVYEANLQLQRRSG